MRRRAFGLLAAVIFVTGCTTASQYSGAPSYAGGSPPVTPPQPPPMTKVGVLLPLSGPGAELGQAMLKAAQLAIGMGDAATSAPPVALDPQDTRGTPDGAANAIQAALHNGDRLILGPLTAQETGVTAPAARAAGVPMLAFTSDPSQAQPGVWVLGITPAQQVRRLVAAAVAENRRQFAAVLGADPFGDALANALNQAVSEAGLAPPDIRRTGAQGLGQTLQNLSQIDQRRAAVQPPSAPAAPASGDSQSSPSTAPTQAPATPPPAPPFDALLVDAAGARAQQLASALASDAVGPPQVRVLGPGLWAGEANRLGGLAGAWFAAPDPAFRAGFEQQYASKYGAPAPRLADLAFDGASLARVLVRQDGYSIGALTQSDGFGGVDGFFALLPDGRVRRGLAVFQIQRGGGAQLVSPAPTNATGPGV